MLSVAHLRIKKTTTVNHAELYIHLNLKRTIREDVHGMSAIDLIGLMDYVDYTIERKTNGRAMDRAEDSVTKYRHLKTYYKLDKETYDKMAKNGCKICSSKEFLNMLIMTIHAVKSKKSCGKCIRGIVCHSCNAHLGKLDAGTIAS